MVKLLSSCHKTRNKAYFLSKNNVVFFQTYYTLLFKHNDDVYVSRIKLEFNTLYAVFIRADWNLISENFYYLSWSAS